MNVDYVFVSGNRAIIALVPGLIKLEEKKPIGVTGLVLHGTSSCLEMADALVGAGHECLSFWRRDGRIFFKKYARHRFFVVNKDLVLTVISPMGRGAVRSTLTLSGVDSWFDLAELLIVASRMIRDHERDFKVPVVSSWKQTAGTPLRPVRL